MRAFVGIDLKGYEKDFRRMPLPKVDGMVPARKHHMTFTFYDSLTRLETEKIRKRLENFRYKRFGVEGDLLVASPDANRPELYALGFSNESDLRDLNRELRISLKDYSKIYFNPHITLLRKEKFSRIFNRSREVCREVDPIKIEIDSIGLFESIVGKEKTKGSGPIYVQHAVRRLGPFSY